MRCPSRALLVVSLLFLGPTRARAQTFQRSALEGTVTDSNGGVIVGASVALEGTRLLGGPWTVATDGRGHYRFGQLLPGSYDVSVTAQGFRPARRTGIALPVETTYTVDVALSVGSLTERVDVSASRALIDVRSSSSPTILTEPLLHDLPTTRTLTSLLSLAPGVTTTPPLNGYVGEVAYGGTQGSGNGITVDGVNLTESTLGDQWSRVHYNWLEEAQVVGPGAPAEYGTFTGAIVNGVLRSGSNRLRGMAELLSIRPRWTADNLVKYPATLAKPIPPKTILSWWDLNGQMGLPLVKDRLWLFTGVSGVHHEYRRDGYRGRARPTSVPARW